MGDRGGSSLIQMFMVGPHWSMGGGSLRLASALKCRSLLLAHKKLNYYQNVTTFCIEV